MAKQATKTNMGNNSGNTEIERTIHDIMINGAKDGRRQYTFVSYMFSNTGNYGKVFLDNFHNSKAGDRTALLDKTLANMSPEYAAVLAEFNRASNKDDKSLTTDERKVLKDKCLAKMGPARKMLDRAIACLHALRNVYDPDSIELDDSGRILMLKAKKKDGTRSTQMLSGNELTAAGNRARPGRKTRVKKAGTDNKPGDEVANPTQYLVNAMEHVGRSVKAIQEKNVTPQLTKATTALFIDLVSRLFAPEGRMSAKDVATFIRNNSAIIVDGQGNAEWKPGDAPNKLPTDEATKQAERDKLDAAAKVVPLKQDAQRGKTAGTKSK